MVSVRVESLTKRYDAVTSIDQVSLEVKGGEIFALIGPSGAGKSTLLRLIDLLEPPTSGKIYLGYLETSSLKEGDRLEAVKRMGLVLQRPVVFNRSVIDNLKYGLEIRNMSGTEVDGEVEYCLGMVGLRELRNRNALRLSGGEAQRVALARTLVCHPEVLLLDEPTANLDPTNVGIIEEAIKEANKKEGTTVLIATHNMFQAKRIAHRVGLMLSGKIVEVDSASEIFRRPKDPRTRSFVKGEMVF
jgi:tungstate transport system ATP-binding protein